MAWRMAVKLARLENHATHRLIASRYPTIGPFDYMPDEEAAAVALVLETATNERLNDVMGRLGRIPPEDLPGAVPTANQAMAAFLHCADTGGRFNTSDLGAWYAGLDLDTAIAETVYHNTRRLRLSASGFPNTIEMRELIARPTADLVDIRPLDDTAIYHPDDYRAGQQFAAEHRQARRDGIWFGSVRRAGGENIAIFKPRLVVPIVQGRHLRYDWNAKGDITIAQISQLPS